MASHRANAQYSSIHAYKSTKKDGTKKKNNQAVLHQAREQRLPKNNRPDFDALASPVSKGLTITDQAVKQILEEDEEDDFVTTRIMRVVLSGVETDKKKSQRVLSFVALVGACAVVGIYLVIPIMIILRITDTILAILIAALILTIMEGIVGIILVNIGTSRKLKGVQQMKVSLPLLPSSVQQSAISALIPMPTPPPVKLPVVPAFLPAAQTVRIPGRNAVGRVDKHRLPVTDPIRLADVAQIETIQINGSRTAVVPPLLKLPASS